MAQPYGAPDWLVLGVPLVTGQVAVIASLKLNSAELAQEVETEIEWFRSHIPFPPRTTLTVEMSECTMVVADDYATAWAGLLRTWSPDRKPRMAIGDVRELEGRTVTVSIPAVEGPGR